jgi:hypothetical protein
MKDSLHILLEQPKPKPGAQRVRPDLFNGNISSDETGSDEINNVNVSHKVSQKCKRLHKPGESELIPEPFKSDLESAVIDAESNDASSYVADHLCYMDEDSPYLALAGRTQSGDDFYFPLTQEGSDWRWIDHEDRSGSPKAKPFEQY